MAGAAFSLQTEVRRAPRVRVSSALWPQARGRHPGAGPQPPSCSRARVGAETRSGGSTAWARRPRPQQRTHAGTSAQRPGGRVWKQRGLDLRHCLLSPRTRGDPG